MMQMSGQRASFERRVQRSSSFQASFDAKSSLPASPFWTRDGTMNIQGEPDGEFSKEKTQKFQAAATQLGQLAEL